MCVCVCVCVCVCIYANLLLTCASIALVLLNLNCKLFITIRILKIITILGVEITHHLWLLSELIVVNYMHIYF